MGDVWSYGIVTGEILSGLGIVDVDREDQDLVSHFINSSEVAGFEPSQLFDAKANWSQATGEKLFGIVMKCLERNKKNRPSMGEVLQTLPTAP